MSKIKIASRTNDTITFRIDGKDMHISKEDWDRLQQFFKEKRKHFGRAIVNNFLNPPEKSYQELKEYFNHEQRNKI